MMRGLLTVLSFLSVLFLPWPVAALFVLGSSVFVPLLPLAVGIFADTLYFAPGAAALPLASVFGLLATIIASLVHNRLAPDIMGE